jgi:hypothetical protein
VREPKSVLMTTRTFGQYDVHALRHIDRGEVRHMTAVKNPPQPTSIRQANVAHGPQQVNNAAQVGAAEPSRAGGLQDEANRLLEQQHGEQQDTRAAQAASGADRAMAALEQVHGTEERRR